MTDKEKVLKVYPDAKLAGNAMIRIVSLSAMKVLSNWYAKGEEEAAWHNAAESLPAQPEQKLGTCGASHVLHTRGLACIEWEPVAPVEANSPEIPDSSTVEAKEKEWYEASDEYIRGFERCKELAERIVDENLGYLDRIGHLDPVTSVAEPKPTRSTPTHHLVERIAAYIESESECLMKIVPEETKHDYGVRLLKVMAEEIREKFQPQPDSSSISSEQTFEDWKNSEEGRCMIHKALPEDAARCAWAAAKGSK